MPRAAGDPATAVSDVARHDPRWVWWTARGTAAPLVAAGLRPRACWDLGAVARLVSGLRREDAPAVWAAAKGVPEPPHVSGPPTLLEAGGDTVLTPDGHLSRVWLADLDLPRAVELVRLALEVQAAQEKALRDLPDPRAAPADPPLRVLTAYAESAAALLAVELEHDGLPVDRTVAEQQLVAEIGPRPADPAAEVEHRTARDLEVLRHFPGDPVDLRNPAQVKALLSRIGLDLPDTRAWRLEPFAATSPGVAALLAWRRAERTSTTYGWGWLDRNVGADGRWRGSWGAADAAAGRMSAAGGLHNLPAELRPAVRAEPGHLFVRADLGQVEPRVLAAVSGDEALTRAAAQDDMYAPVADQLRCDRPRAKVAVLAAMYGQTSGTAGAALKEMDRVYPVAMAYLRDAEQAGLARTDLRTYGGRLLRLAPRPGEALPEPVGEHVQTPTGYGRFARNAVVQGAAAELFKAWAATVRAGLSYGRIVLCLHDELLLHVPADRADDASRLLVDALQATASWWAAGSRVRFVAEVGVGASWPDAH
ncbi:MAG: DNA polymerase I [Actinobacteria bacterium]|nr:DNA polymerase I [Actinomycetota bacterium]